MIASLLVHVSIATLEGGQVEAAARLAQRLSARLIGVAAGFPPPPVTAEFGGMPGYLVQQIVKDIEDELEAAGRGFREAASGLPETLVEWRGAVRPQEDHLRAQARAADLVILGPRDPGDSPLWAIDPADIMMTAGRPVLLARPGERSLDPERVLVAWKDAPQARRAVRDSLDLLRRASAVIVCGVGREASKAALEDVAAYLASHHVSASVVHEESRDAAGPALRRIAEDQGARMIVAGAYGHSRVREWALGGVTRDLIENAVVSCLFSH